MEVLLLDGIQSWACGSMIPLLRHNSLTLHNFLFKIHKAACLGFQVRFVKGASGGGGGGGGVGL